MKPTCDWCCNRFCRGNSQGNYSTTRTSSGVRSSISGLSL
jgi:hypothetical protein